MTDSIFNLMAERNNQIRSEMQEAIVSLRKTFLYLHGANPELNKISIRYYGSGDSGSVDEVKFFGKPPADRPYSEPDLDAESFPLSKPMPVEIIDAPARTTRWDPDEQRVVDVPARNQTPDEILDRTAWDLAYGENPGFEINEGGYGDVIVTFRDEYEPSDTPPTEADILVRLEHKEIVETTNDYEYDY